MLIPTKNPNKKYYINSGIVVIVVIALFGITSYQLSSTVIATRKEREACKNFKTQSEAQAKYNKYINTEYSKYVKQLDSDNDGVPCEHLPIK